LFQKVKILKLNIGNPIKDYLFCNVLLLFSSWIYKEEVRDRLWDPLATWKIQGAKSCQMKMVSFGNINS